MSTPTSRQTARKTKDQKLKEEQEARELQEKLDKERAEELRKPTEFTNYEFVEKCLLLQSDVTELTAYLSHELKLKDYLINLRSSIWIDFHIQNIEYCVDHSFNLRQASIFLHLMDTLRDMVVQQGSTQQSVISFLKQRLIGTSRPLSYEEEEQWRINREKRMEEEKKRLEAEKNTKGKRPTSKATSKKKDDEKKIEEEKKKKLEEETKKRREEEIERLEKFPAFNVDDVAGITEYITEGILQHFTLFKAVFNHERSMEVLSYKPYVETLLEVVYPLSSGMDEKVYLEAKEEEKRKEEQEKQRVIEEEIERKKKASEEAEQEYKRKVEERNAPKLTSDQLEEIANYLKFQIEKDLDGKRDDLLCRIETLSTNLSKSNK